MCVSLPAHRPMHVPHPPPSFPYCIEAASIAKPEARAFG